MKKFITYGSIEQFRKIIKDVKHTAQYIGQDDDGNAILDRCAKMPILTATLSEKIHGSHSSVCYNSVGGFWVQSRKNIITIKQDNAGCAFAYTRDKDTWMKIILKLATEYNIDLAKNTISVYSEWAGGNIQKSSACSGLDKLSVIFPHFKVTPFEEGSHAYWLETKVGTTYIPLGVENIVNIMNYKTFTIDIDFNNVSKAQNTMVDLVLNDIEPSSPFGQAMGIDNNVGEGLVATLLYNGNVLKFKIKGEKHSKSKVKTLNKVDDVKEQAKIDFANYSCTSSRLQQAWQTTFGINNEKVTPDIKHTGNFIRNVIADVMKEELDVLFEKQLEPKDVNSKLSQIAREWFKEELDKFYGVI